MQDSVRMRSFPNIGVIFIVTILSTILAKNLQYPSRERNTEEVISDLRTETEERDSDPQIFFNKRYQENKNGLQDYLAQQHETEPKTRVKRSFPFEGFKKYKPPPHRSHRFKSKHLSKHHHDPMEVQYLRRHHHDSDHTLGKHKKKRKKAQLIAMRISWTNLLKHKKKSLRLIKIKTRGLTAKDLLGSKCKKDLDCEENEAEKNSSSVSVEDSVRWSSSSATSEEDKGISDLGIPSDLPVGDDRPYRPHYHRPPSEQKMANPVEPSRAKPTRLAFTE